MNCTRVKSGAGLDRGDASKIQLTSWKERKTKPKFNDKPCPRDRRILLHSGPGCNITYYIHDRLFLIGQNINKAQKNAVQHCSMLSHSALYVLFFLNLFGIFF